MKSQFPSRVKFPLRYIFIICESKSPKINSFSLFPGNVPTWMVTHFIVMLDLKEKIEESLSRNDVKAIVISGLNGKFSAGFNVTVFGGMLAKTTHKELGFMSIEFVTDTLEAARKPLVAAIEGPAFGGGLEIALACHARVSTSTAQLGLTELHYGILPGLGGTQRLPRLVGLSKALDMILMSKIVDGEEARRLSLVDGIAPVDKLLGVARRWALDIIECRKPWVLSLYKTDKLEPLVEAREILKSARLKVQTQNPNLVHQLVCIDVIEQGIVSGPRSALWKEAEALQELRQSSTCRSLVHAFFAQRQVFKIPGITEAKLLPRKINRVAVIGGGLMSSEIAKMLVLSNYQVILKEKDEKILLEQIQRVIGKLQDHVKTGKATLNRLEKAVSLLKGVLDYDSFGDVDLVIEAEAEILSLKQEVFASLEKSCPLHSILTTTTSTFSLRLIGEKTNCQSRITRIHFSCPSPSWPLMEIVRMKSTSPQVIVDLIDFGKKMRKTPIVINDWKGYSVNSMFIAYLHAAVLLAEGGLDLYLIDQNLASFGTQFGPFRMIDKLGFQSFEAMVRIFIKNLPGSSHEPKLISILREYDYEGESNGKGFYKYDADGLNSPNPETMKYIKEARNISNASNGSKVMEMSNEDMVEAILFPVVNKACQLLSEEVVTRSTDLDVASVLGMGFPKFRGGIIYWCDTLGSDYIYSKLEKLSNVFGEFFKPCDYITEQAAKGISLAEGKIQGKSQL